MPRIRAQRLKDKIANKKRPVNRNPKIPHMKNKA